MPIRSVSAPKAPFGLPSTAASKPPGLPSPASLAKALSHHGKVGAALKAGNHKQAMHHTGHMLLAIRKALPAIQPGGSIVPPAPASTTMDADTDDSAQPPAPSAPAGPTKKPFNRAAFGAMKGKPV